MFTMGPPLWGGEAGDPYAGSVLGLLHFNEADGTAVPSSSLGSPTITNDGSASAPTTNAVKSTTPKFGAGAWLAAGGSTGLDVAAVTSSAVPYTIECFVMPVTLGAFGRFLAATALGGGSAFALAYGGGAVNYVDLTGTNRATTGVMSTGTWYYIAICYDGTNVRIYQDGTLIFTSSTYSRNLSSDTVTIAIGCSGGLGGADGTARFDEFRWTHGVDRSAGGTTPPATPTAEFPNS